MLQCARTDERLKARKTIDWRTIGGRPSATVRDCGPLAAATKEPLEWRPVWRREKSRKVELLKKRERQKRDTECELALGSWA